MTTSFQHEAIIRSIKCVDISLIGIYYLVLGILFAMALNELFKETKKEKQMLKKSMPHLLLKLLMQTSLIMISVYIMRQIVKRIPFPLDGVCGYDHMRIKEINGAVIMAFVVITLQTNYGADLTVLTNQLHHIVFGYKESNSTNKTNV